MLCVCQPHQHETCYQAALPQVGIVAFSVIPKDTTALCPVWALK